MTSGDDADRSTTAATHGEQAASHKRRATAHFEFTKGWAHDAHQAFLARGYALHAIDHVAKDGPALSTAPELVPSIAAPSPDQNGIDMDQLSDTAHHAAAADHCAQAAYHHGEASKHCESKEYALAAQAAEIANRHAQLSVFHGNQAAKHHVEHLGRSGPTADIA
jgi:hypothetical protein